MHTLWGPRERFLRVVVEAHSWGVTSPGSLKRRHADLQSMCRLLIFPPLLLCLSRRQRACLAIPYTLSVLSPLLSSKCLFATSLSLSFLSGTWTDLSCLLRANHSVINLQLLIDLWVQLSDKCVFLAGISPVTHSALHINASCGLLSRPSYYLNSPPRQQ